MVTGLLAGARSHRLHPAAVLRQRDKWHYTGCDRRLGTLLPPPATQQYMPGTGAATPILSTPLKIIHAKHTRNMASSIAFAVGRKPVLHR